MNVPLSTPHQWDAEYREGVWEHMASEDQRYRSVSALILRTVLPGHQIDLLDVGCGPGNLVPYLSPIERYTGLDISAAAVGRAPRGPGIEYTVARLEDYEPERQFSTILFNEVLYYCQFEEMIPRYAKFLKPEGHMVTSLYDGMGQSPGLVEAISNCLDEHLLLLERTIITDDWRSWSLALYALAD
jgi:trans-aconitate methyltransferase